MSGRNSIRTQLLFVFSFSGNKYKPNEDGVPVAVGQEGEVEQEQ